MAGTAAGAVYAVSATTSLADSRGWHSGKGGHMAADITFADLDADGDGQLTEEELASAHQVWLASKDADGDGMLSQEELNAAIAERIMAMAESQTARMIERMDDDGDGMISAEEIGDGRNPGKAFSRLDSDDDGMISEEEFSQMMNRDGRWKRGKDGRGKRHGDRK